MAPIYDTDIAEERWTADIWKSYELWERVERRFRRKRRMWLAAAGTAFVLLASIPVLQDSLPKWRSLRAARILATVVADSRLQAARYRQVILLSLEVNQGGLGYRIERVASCAASKGDLILERPLLEGEQGKQFALLPPEVAAQSGIPGIVRSYCYDPYRGGGAAAGGEGLLGLAILPVKDLADARFDRMSMVLIDPVSGAVSIN